MARLFKLHSQGLKVTSARSIISKVDLPRLAGFRSMLGIDITGTRAHIVELAREGNPLSRYSCRFRVLKSLTVTFLPQDSPEDKGEAIRESLAQNGIRTIHAVTSVQSPAIRRVSASIPRTVTNIDEWIAENLSRLLKLPIHLDQVAFQCEIGEVTETEFRATITFVRKDDLAVYRKIFESARLTLVSLSTGVSDAVNPLLVLQTETNWHSFVYINESLASAFQIHDRAKVTETALTLSELRTQIVNLSAGGSGGGVTLVGGEVESSGELHDIEPFSPMGLGPEYALGAGLAIKGWLPEINANDFRETTEKERHAEVLYRSLAHRTFIGLGAMILFLLGSQMLVSSMLRARLENAEAQLTATGSAMREIQDLEDEATTLKSRVDRSETTSRSTSTARLLHDLAGLTPPGVLVSKMSIEFTQGAEFRVQITGSALSNEDLALFLKALSASNRCLDARLVRTGSGRTQRGSLTAAVVADARLTFEIIGSFKL
jgi:hypothetical protein